jgi:hypothetical protein
VSHPVKEHVGVLARDRERHIIWRFPPNCGALEHITNLPSGYLIRVECHIFGEGTAQDYIGQTFQKAPEDFPLRRWNADTAPDYDVTWPNGDPSGQGSPCCQPSLIVPVRFLVPNLITTTVEIPSAGNKEFMLAWVYDYPIRTLRGFA